MTRGGITAWQQFSVYKYHRPSMVVSFAHILLYMPRLSKDKYELRHWKRDVLILMTSSSVDALEVKMTTSRAVSDEDFIKVKTWPYQWIEKKGIQSSLQKLYV